MRRLFSLLLLFGCEETALIGDAGPQDGGPFRPCSIHFDVDENQTIGPDLCSSFVVVETIRVQNGATLTILPGTTLAFERGKGIQVLDGRVLIEGTDDDRITLTSLSEAPMTADRWGGVLFTGSALPGSRIAYTNILNAGNGADANGCVTVRNSVQEAVTLEAVRMERCSGAGLWVDASGVTLEGTDIAFIECEVGMSLAARNLKDVTRPLIHEAVATNVLRGGTVQKTASWVAQTVPWLVTSDLTVAGPSEPVLTLEAGIQLRFAESTGLYVGQEAPGVLKVEGDRFSPVRLEAHEAQWHGVLFDTEASERSALDHLIINGGGQQGTDVRGCITLRGARPVAISNVRFEECAQAGIAALDDDRFRFDTLTNNTFVDAEVGLAVLAPILGSITTSQNYEDVEHNVVEGGDIAESTVWRPQSVPWNVRGSVNVRGSEAPVLRIEPGTHLTFDSGTWLQIGSAGAGGLQAVGTESRPIVFEAAGDVWRGLVFGLDATAGGELDQVIIRNGGQREADVQGCITIRSGVSALRTISVRRTRFESCEQAGVSATDESFGFGLFSDNTFITSEVALQLSPAAAGSIDSSQVYEAVERNLITGGTLTSPATWSPQDVPWEVLGQIFVEGPNAPTLTLNAGVDLRFADAAILAVGLNAPGGLVVGGAQTMPIHMSSALESPGPGDWHGLLLGPAVAPSTRIDFLELSHAGKFGPEVRGALTLLDTGTNVRISGSRFVDNGQSDVFVDCGSQPLLSSNVYESTPSGLLYETGCP